MSIAVLGFVAAFFTTFSTLPQTLKTLRSRKTKDISLQMYVMLGTGVLLWIFYGFFIKDMPLILANIVTILFVIPILILKVKHG